MIKCEKCETQAPDSAKFCPKCGAPMVKHEQHVAPAPDKTAEQPAGQSASAPQQQKKSSSGFSEFINKHFWVLFVSTGVLAYLLMEVAGMYMGDGVFGFAITLCVFALLSAICFCVIAVLNKVLAGAEDKKKHAVRDNVCLAVGIILFVMVLLGVAAIMDNCSYYL